MPKISFAGLKDPGKRARFIIWLGVVGLAGVALVIVALGATSGYWFCANGCHKVQDDTITAYNHSSHNKIACMACHMPVNANPVIFMLHKAEALGELYMTVTNNYELPLNGFSAVSLEMKAAQCTQCHNLENRVVTPASGVIIDHAKHIEEEVACTVCHNRVGHREDFEPVLKDPNTKEPNRKHADFMKMNACFRCHGHEKDAKAPGRCSACHPKGFKLKPPTHEAKGFFPKGHAERAKESLAENAAAAKEREEFLAELAGAEGGEGHEPVGLEIPFAGQVFECGTCHQQKFCTDCHGVQMPHPAEFKEPKKANDPNGHPVIARKLTKKCVMCHGNNRKTHFCDDCHHGKQINFKFNKGRAWQRQHPDAVEASGLDSCLAKCHTQKFCSNCHTRKKVVPTSHRQRYWVKPRYRTVTVWGKSPAKPAAKHAVEAQKAIQSCEICHGSGGPNARFCRGCHNANMPHPQKFTEFHAKTGRDRPQVCRNCHDWKELCSNCHHLGSSFSRPWLAVHGGSAMKNGPQGCLEQCHQKRDCSSCHTRRRVVPASHRAKRFVRDASSNKAMHVQAYSKDAAICTYCHGDGGPKARFCAGCHKLTMPHPIDEALNQKFEHKPAFKTKKLKKGTCANCHPTRFCDSCHHKGSVATRPWLKQHPNVVKKGGRNAAQELCFTECHTQGEVFCSNCHVNLAKRGLID